MYRGGIYHHLYINDFIDRNSEVFAQIERDDRKGFNSLGWGGWSERSYGALINPLHFENTEY